MHIALFDKDDAFCELLVAQIQKYFCNTHSIIDDYSCLEDLKNTLADGNHIDLLFYDLESESIFENNDLLQEIIEKCSQTIFVFFSKRMGNLNFFRDEHPCLFIQKPVDFSNLTQRLCELFLYLDSNLHLKITSGYRTVFLPYDEILYIESDKRISKIHCKKEILSTYRKLDELQCELSKSSRNFIRIHQSFLININHIEEFCTKSIIINNCSLPISKKYLTAVANKIRNT